MKLLVTIIVLASLVGCASTAPPQPLSSVLTTPRPGTGIVVVRREDTLFGGGCGQRVLFDGRPVADLDRGQQISIYADPGEHALGVRIVSRICAEYSDDINVLVKAGERLIYEVGPRLGLTGGIGISPAKP